MSKRFVSALSKTSISESVTEYNTPSCDVDDDEDDSESETVVYDETVDQIEKIWASLLVTDNTGADTFDWDS